MNSLHPPNRLQEAAREIALSSTGTAERARAWFRFGDAGF